MGGKKSVAQPIAPRSAKEVFSAFLPDEPLRASRKAKPGKPILQPPMPLSARWRSIFSVEAEPFARKMLALAKKGNPQALRLVSEEMRSLRRLEFKIGPTNTLTDISEAQDDIVQGIRTGELSVSEAAALSTVLDNLGEAMKRREFENRLSEVEIFITENQKP